MAIPINNNQINPSTQPKQQGSGFTNLQSLLNANRNNRLGTTLGQGIQNTIGGAQQNLSQASNQFNQQSQQNAIGTEADKSQAQQAINQAATSPSDLSQSSVDAFNKYRAGYQGPAGFSQAQQQSLGQQQGDINSIANATLSQSGRTGLLQRYIGAPQYTQGQKQLDTLLLGQQGNQALKGARRQGLQFGNQVGTQEQQAANKGQALNQQAQAFNEQINKDLTGAATGVQTGIQTRADQEQAQAQKAYDAFQRILDYQKGSTSGGVGGGKNMIQVVSGGVPQLDQATYDYLTKAIGPEALTTQGYTGLQDYLKTGANPLNQAAIKQDVSNYVKPEDVSKFQALQKLAAPNQELISGYAIPGQAGNAPSESRFLDQAALNKAVEQGNQNYDKFTKEQVPVLQRNFQNVADIASSVGGLGLPGWSGGALNTMQGAQNFSDYLRGSQKFQDFMNSGGGPSYLGRTDYARIAPNYTAAQQLLDQYNNYQAHAPTLQDILNQGLVKS